MLEQRRLDYLKAMGIKAWMPRSALPHAPSPRWLADDCSAKPSGSISAEPEYDGTQSAASDLLRSGSALKKPFTPPAEVRAEATAGEEQQIQQQQVQQQGQKDISETVVPSAGEPPRFALEFLQISSDCVWVFDASQPIDRAIPFVTRIVRAFDTGVTIIPQPVSFRWPFIESRHQDQSEAVALQALKAQWQHFDAQSVQGIISVGPAAQTWMAKTGVNCRYHVEDVDALMHSAESKRALWLALIPLFQHSDSH